MAYELYTGSYDDEQARVAYYMQLFQQVRSRRVNFEVLWEEAAALVWPEYRNSFSFGHVRPPGMKYDQFQVDSQGSIHSWRFMAIVDTMLTPWTMPWSLVRCSNKDLRKDRSVKLYYAEKNRILWEQRYRPEANFVGSSQVNYQGLGVFGNMGMFVDELDTRPAKVKPGIRYISCPPGSVYILANHQGRIDGFIRHFRWTARQAYQCWPEKVPAALMAALQKNSQELFDFLHFCLPNTDYRPDELFTPRSKPWSSCYLSVTGYSILEEGGYRTFPLPYGRYSVAPEEENGRGPGQQALAELKTANAQKGMFLKQGHRAGDPAYLLPGDDTLDWKFHSGSLNYGGMNEDGRKLVDVVPTGEIQVTKEMMDKSDAIIASAFLSDLFPLLFRPQDGGQRSAREVIEMANERGMFLAPTLGRQFTEYLGPMVEREIDILESQKQFPEKPGVLKEAEGEYRDETQWTAPLARALNGTSVAGFMRTVEMAQGIVNQGGDPELLDAFDFDEAFPDIAEIQFVPPEWMAAPEKMAQKRKGRAQSAERDRQVKEMPGRAAMAKAEAIQSKAQAGQNIGGTLSGVPQGQMPMMPSAPMGSPGMPGVGGRPGTPGRPAR